MRHIGSVFSVSFQYECSVQLYIEVACLQAALPVFQHIPNRIVSLHAVGQRVLVCDIQESVHWVRYRRSENQLVIFADDTYPRWVTSAALLDYGTVAVGDKFGNIAIVRYLVRAFWWAVKSEPPCVFSCVCRLTSTTTCRKTRAARRLCGRAACSTVARKR